MKNVNFVDELFYFEPRQYGLNQDHLLDVHIIGEFNDWGHNQEKLKEYRLAEDKVGRWVGLFKVPEGKHFYKFLINRSQILPTMGLFIYSTVSTPNWAQKAIWYQIMVDRFYKADHTGKVPNCLSWDAPPDYFNNFGGNLRGIKEKIPYLKNLFGGLENVAIYLNPLHKSLASNHKYWPEDFDAIDEQFGDEKDLKELIDSIHQEKGRIILDLVYNHTGLNHYAFLDILENGKNSEYYHWYRKLVHREGGKIEIPILEKYVGDTPQNLEIINDPRKSSFNAEEKSFFSIWDGKYKFPIVEPEKIRTQSIKEVLNHQPYYKLVSINDNGSYASWAGFFEIPELNTKNPEVKEHLFKSAKKWVKLGVDGFRLDVPDLLNGAHEFWKEFRQEVREEAELNNKNPDDIYIVGELWTGEGNVPSFLFAGEDKKPLRYDAIMNYPVRESILNFFTGEILNKATDRVIGAGEISAEEMDCNFHRNLGYVSWGTDKVQFNPLSSHDTRRIRTVLNDDRKLKASLIMQFTLVGAPTIYYGDELGMQGGTDPANRQTMRWNIYEDLLHHRQESEIFNLYKQLIDLRKKLGCLVNSPLFTLKVHNNNKTYSYGRYLNNSDCVVALITRSEASQDIELDISNTPFENVSNWKNPVTEKKYFNYARNLLIKSEDLKDCFGIALIPDE